MELMPIKRWAHHMGMLKNHDQSLWMNHVIKDSIFWLLSIIVAFYVASSIAFAFFYE
ncbi:MAG: hypothetical protein KAS96_05605 [Planctomycetes bacterium]|nr:hypothetical protein [Planctomycetota bacterium]